MMPWTIDIDSRGNVAGDVLQPVEHAQKNNFQGKERSVTLRYDGHGGFIERKVLPDAQEDQRDEVPADQTKCTVLGLKEGNEYQFRVKAVNKAGACASDPSRTMIAKARNRKLLCRFLLGLRLTLVTVMRTWLLS